ncbi:LOW QUALITY PROTEIN: probable RNA-directed DNA polymerase from transposon X-element [Aspergillus udagawae]|uniref:Probable RNA-directed DNA polymerase from transposon X-element n=1 Tax=Aspergillus udagawae TaxID=91492 RepID=A0A8H3SBU9_9EURO|nr:LOW QUALITY PROTEIN: probable RNA-directed DNA polymerase from transposon X-element [Aspergillus udagawae]
MASPIPANINSESELMKNQKYASVMDPARQFDALQNPDGTSLFFAIGGDDVLYATRETTASKTGWVKYDISSVLAGRFAQKTIAATQFAVTQSPRSTNSVDLAVVTRLNGNDSLFLALDVSNTPSTWENSPYWVSASFDARDRPEPIPFTIADVYLLNIPGYGVLCFADVIRNPADNTQAVDRYYIDIKSDPMWTFHPLPDNISAGSVITCLGKRPQDPVGGIYTFGFLGSNEDLIYTPAATKDRPFPESVHLRIPPDATSIASMVDPSSGNTFLFFVWPLAGAIFVFTPDNQYDGAYAEIATQSSFIFSTQILVDTRNLIANSVAGRTPILPIGFRDKLECVVQPVPICYDVFQFAHYLNAYQGAANSILFAQTSDNQLTQLTQDPSTSIWAERSVLLPGDNVDSVIDFYSYTSHVQLVDVNGMGVPNYAVSLSSSTGPISVNINDIYMILRPDETVQTSTNLSGVITIIEETQTLSGTAINVTVHVKDSPDIVEIIDPHDNACQRLSTITTGDALQAATATDSNGVTTPLVPQSSMPLDRLGFAGDQFQTLLDIKSRLPVNGAATKARRGLLVDGPLKDGASSAIAENGGSWIKLLWGDLLRWFKKAWNTVKRAYSKVVDGVWHFIVEVGNDIYSAAIETVAAVVGAAEYVFHQIVVAYDDIVKYLGFIFNWDDIKRTHLVVKNILRLSVQQVTNSITEIEDDIRNEFATIEEKVDQWGSLPDPGQTIGQQEATQSSVPSRNSPQANWALHHATSNLQSAQSDHDLSVPVTEELENAFKALYNLLEAEETDIVGLVKSLVDLVKDFASLSAKQLFEENAAIITDFVLNTAENCILTLLDLTKLFADALFALLDAPLNIPILSPIYKDISGDQLSFLDLACLVGAIPATVIYKAITNTAPFPANELTNRLCYTSQHSQYVPAQPGAAKGLCEIYNDDTRKGNLVAVDKAKVFDICTIVSNGVSFVSGFFVWACSAGKAATPPGVPASKTFRSISMVSYLGIGKVAVDNIATNQEYLDISGPLSECALNVAWVVPAVGDFIENNRTESTRASFSANILFDVGGMLAPRTSEYLFPGETPGVVLAAQFALTTGYAVCCLITGIAVANGD